MGKTEESPAPIDDLQPLRRSKRRRTAVLKFCRGAECSPEVLPRTPDLVNPTCFLESVAAEPKAKLFDQAKPASIASPRGIIDLEFLLNCDAVSRDFLFPHFSFDDLLALEMTSKSVRNVVWSKQVWRKRVDEFRRKDKHGDKLISRYSSSLSVNNPEYHKKMISKYLKDNSKVYQNVKGANWKSCGKTFDIETTCHRAFAIHESGRYAFIQDANDIQVLSLDTNKSKRGVILNILKSFPIVQPDDYCSLISCHGDIVFHATYRQLHAWDWRRDGLRVEIENSERRDVTGLGLLRAVIVQDDCLVIGSNDGGEPYPSTGKVLVQVWRMKYDYGNARKPVLNLEVFAQKTDEPKKNAVWDEWADYDQYRIRRATAISLDGDKELIAIGYSFSFCHIREQFDHRFLGKLRIYDHESETWVCSRWFNAGASQLRINATQRKALVGFDKNCFKSKPYVLILNADTGDTMKEVRSSHEDMTCLWTDWKRFIFTGNVHVLLVWEVVFGVDDVGEKSLVPVYEEFCTGLSGNKGLPESDKIYDVFFDGFHLIVYTRGQMRASVRVFDCLRLNSVKF